MGDTRVRRRRPQRSQDTSAVRWKLTPSAVPARRLRAEPAREVVPLPPVGRRPRDLGDCRQARERHVLDIAKVHERLGPDRRLDAEHRAFGDALERSTRDPSRRRAARRCCPPSSARAPSRPSYFMSRYARLAGDRISRGALDRASAGAFGRQCCTIDVGSRVAAAISSHPTICLPCFCTIPCTRSMNCRYWSGVSFFDLVAADVDSTVPASSPRSPAPHRR